MQCIKCGSDHVRTSRRLTPTDLVHWFKREQAFRCRKCHVRFFAPRDPRASISARIQRQFSSHRERERLKNRVRTKVTPILLFGLGLAVFAVFLKYLSSMG